MKRKKSTFAIIIILLVIFLPITIFSTTMHFKNIKPSNVNPNHEFKFEDKLYFYDDEDNLLGTYTCENDISNCNYATNEYSSNYALDEVKNDANTLGVISNRYAFLIDDNGITDPNILLYDITLGKVLNEYLEVKNYGVGIENDYYILKNENNLYGVVSLDGGISLKIPFKYEYIGLVNKIDADTGKVINDAFAVLEDGNWYLMDINGAKFTDSIDSEIISYNGEYIILKNGSLMNLIDYDGKTILSNYKYLNFYNKYLEVIDNYNRFYLTNINSTEKISNEYYVSSINDVLLEIKDNKLNLYIKDTLEETIAIN